MAARARARALCFFPRLHRHRSQRKDDRKPKREWAFLAVAGKALERRAAPLVTRVRHMAAMEANGE
jgi:hypothetical protein